jgi:hypothetical protein
LIVLGLGLLAENLDLLGDWKVPIWSLILGASGLLFLGIYASDHEQWWALIPGLVLVGIAVAIFMSEQGLIADYVVGPIIMATIALPFLLIYLTDRSRWWALIPAFTLGAAAVAVFLEGVGAISDEALASVIVGGTSLGFLSIYLVDREQWWSLIPGGIMALIAFFLLLATATEYILPLGLILLGLLLLRGTLGGGRRRTKTWAPFPAPSSPADSTSQTVEPVRPERMRLPTLEEQIEAAVAEESESRSEPAKEKPTSKEAGAKEPASPSDIPPAAEIPEPPEDPASPKM